MNSTMNTIHKLIFDGGTINWIIIGMYILMLVIACERFVYYMLGKYNRKKLLADIASFTSMADIESFCKMQRSKRQMLFNTPLFVIREFLKEKDSMAAVVNETLDRCVFTIRKDHNARLDILSLLANIAPLCGLLGTVTGLMDAFNAIQVNGGVVKMDSLAGGIWTAMITTATGLIVAIPALVFVAIFENSLERRLSDLSHIISILKQKFRPDCLSEEKPQA